MSRSAAVIYCAERSTRAESWAVGWREAGARGFGATRIVFMRRVAANLRAALRRDPTGAQEAARILGRREVFPAAERDTPHPAGGLRLRRASSELSGGAKEAPASARSRELRAERVRVVRTN